MHAHDLLKLIGVVIIVAGIALRLRTTLVVVVAALATGLVAGLPLFSHEGFFQSIPYLTKPGQTGIINTLGKAFADNRLMTLFILTLPAIGLAEAFGLQEQSAALIRRIRAATVGRLQIVYQLFRVLHGLMGIRLNGHPSFVRPLIFPMALGAAQVAISVPLTSSVPRAVASGSSDGPPVTDNSLATARGTDRQVSGTDRQVSGTDRQVSGTDRQVSGTDPSARAVERIKAASAAAENYGNFYGQNLSPVQAGILLVYGVMQGLGFTIGLWDLVYYTIPVVAASIVFAFVQFTWLDRWLKRETNLKSEVGR